MTKKNTLVAVLLLVVMCVLLITTPIAYVTYQNYQSYQRDLNILMSISAQLGYLPDRQLNLYEDSAMTYHILAVVFYSPTSLDQFSANIASSGLKQEFFFPKDTSGSKYSFIELVVNRGLFGQVITINGYHKKVDIEAKDVAPIIARWGLFDPATKKTIDIYFARPAGAQDKWFRDGKPLEGNIVVIKINRR
mgnify:FL=1